MQGTLLRLLIIILGLSLASALVPGVAIHGAWSFIIAAILLGDNGHLWFGTNGGIMEFDGNTFTNHPLTGERSTVVTWLAEDEQHNIWCGTNGDGLGKFNPTTKSYEFFDDVENGGVLQAGFDEGFEGAGAVAGGAAAGIVVAVGENDRIGPLRFGAAQGFAGGGHVEMPIGAALIH